MNFLLKKLASLNIGWNERPLTEADLYALCKRFKITVEEMPLRVSGFYYCVMGRHFIAVNSGLSADRKLFVLFHEFAHFLLHAPDRGATANFHGIGRRDRKETEADLVALIALMPTNKVIHRDPSELIEEGFDAEHVRDRFLILEKYGI
ncbi:MAG: ImmA/IrrE family metallo-endopeptidase [Acidobacteria bacterium]|nr:ImmA/IrrE family metallo-endopeptidase [Acidobacteriota bacterium]